MPGKEFLFDGDAPAAIASYEQAAATLKDANYYGLEEFDNNMKEAAWRNFKLAFYMKRVADAHQKIRRTKETSAAYAAAQKLIDNAYASSDLTAQTRTQLEQLSNQLLKRN